MKKLMIAAAIVCAAAFAQAATVDWSTGRAYGPDVDLDQVVDGAHYGASSPTMASLLEDYATSYGLTWSYSGTVGGESVSGSLGEDDFASGKISTVVNAPGFVLPTDESEKTIGWEIVITGNYQIDDKVYTLTSDVIKGSEKYTKLSDPIIATDAPSGWNATVTGPTPTPEPTSGLLLLLGVAGLALRRRRA